MSPPYKYSNTSTTNDVLSGLGKIGGGFGYSVRASEFLPFVDTVHPLLGNLVGSCWWGCWLGVNVVTALHFLFNVNIVGDN